MKINDSSKILLNTLNNPSYSYDNIEDPPTSLDCYASDFDGSIGKLRKLAVHKTHDDYVVDAHPDGSFAYVDGDKLFIATKEKKSKVPLVTSMQGAQFDKDWTTGFRVDWSSKQLWLSKPDGSNCHRGYEDENWKFQGLKSHDGKVFAAIVDPAFKGTKIVEVNPDGCSSQTVWELPGINTWEFDLSPDGTKLAYVDWDSDHVYLKSKGTSKPTQIDDPSVEGDFVLGDTQYHGCPRFSPKGDSLLYAIQSTWFDEGESTYSDHGDLFKCDLNSGEVDYLEGSQGSQDVAEVFFAGMQDTTSSKAAHGG